MKVTLRAARVNAGLTQREAAERLGKDSHTILNWEKGRFSIDTGNFLALCSMYGCTKDDIIMPDSSALSEQNKEGKK